MPFLEITSGNQSGTIGLYGDPLFQTEAYIAMFDVKNWTFIQNAETIFTFSNLDHARNITYANGEFSFLLSGFYDMIMQPIVTNGQGENIIYFWHEIFRNGAWFRPTNAAIKVKFAANTSNQTREANLVPSEYLHRGEKVRFKALKATTSDVRILYEPLQLSPFRPEVPSIFVSIHRSGNQT